MTNTSMDISSYSRSKKPTRSEMEQISAFLVEMLSSYLQADVSQFRRHIVDGESCVSNVQGSLGSESVFDLRFEGVVLVQVRNNTPPSVNAELLFFSRGARVGLQDQNGRSFLVLDFDMKKTPAWKVNGWRMDGPDDWERITSLRTDEYNTFKDTWEDND